MRVRFHDECDRCGARSDEYVPLPTCRECDEHICPTCAVPGSLRQREFDGPDGFATMREDVLCHACDRHSPVCPCCTRQVASLTERGICAACAAYPLD